MLNSAAEPQDSQLSSQVPPDPPKPGPIPERIQMDPNMIISTNITTLPAIKRKPTICAVSPSDFAMMIFSRTYDTGPPPIVEGTTVLCESLARGTGVCWTLLASSVKITFCCVFVPNANANQTIEPKHVKTEIKPMHKKVRLTPGSTVSPVSYIILPRIFTACQMTMAMPARIAGPANFLLSIQSTRHSFTLQ